MEERERQKQSSSDAPIRLSLVVPCYNEEENVRAFYEETVKAFDGCGYRYELVMVNDGSRDQTARELKKLFEEKKGETELTIIHFSRNFGKEAAIYAGLRRARGEMVTLIDADLQQRPEIARKMVEILDAEPEYECVAAYQEKREEGRVISFCKKMFYKVINRMTEISFVSDASDFRTFRRVMADAILQITEYHRFSKGIFSWVGFSTKYIPYHVEERHAGTSKWSFWKLVRYAVDGILGFSTTPLRVSTWLGGLSAFLSVVYFLVVVIKRLAFGVDVPGYASIVALILLIGGIQMLMLGIIGEYLARMYIQGKKRPVYIEKLVQTTGGDEDTQEPASGGTPAAR